MPIPHPPPRNPKYELIDQCVEGLLRLSVQDRREIAAYIQEHIDREYGVPEMIEPNTPSDPGVLTFDIQGRAGARRQFPFATMMAPRKRSI